MRERSATTKDVAKAAGVSVATVSRVLNNSGYVGPELTERVWDAVRRLDYRPNTLARGLKTNKTSTVGIVISNIMNPFFTAVVRGIEDRANEEGLTVILCNTDENPDKQEEYLSVLIEKQVDGLLISPVPAHDRHLPVGLANHLTRIPIVFVDRRSRDLDGSVVLVDNIQGAYCAVEHLIALGHERIGIVTGPLNLTTGSDRLEGYRLALADHGIGYDERLSRIADFKLEQAEAKTMELLSQSVAPTALFVANNLMTIGALRAIRKKGLSIPNDIALVTFDDPEWAEFIHPALTAVAQPTYELGLCAMGLLAKEIENPSIEKQEVVLGCELVVRESCGVHR